MTPSAMTPWWWWPKSWWTHPRLKCPPEVAAEFEARDAYKKERAAAGDYAAIYEGPPLSKTAKRIEARWLDLQADMSERARNTPTYYKDIRLTERDTECERERIAERLFEIALGLRTR